MRFNLETAPKEGARRWVKKFLWWPQQWPVWGRNAKQVLWWEWAYLEEKYHLEYGWCRTLNVRKLEEGNSNDNQSET